MKVIYEINSLISSIRKLRRAGKHKRFNIELCNALDSGIEKYSHMTRDKGSEEIYILFDEVRMYKDSGRTYMLLDEVKMQKPYDLPQNIKKIMNQFRSKNREWFNFRVDNDINALVMRIYHRSEIHGK